MVLDESMHKSVVLIGVSGGGTKGKEAIIEVLVNNLGLTANNEGVDSLSMAVSIVGITLAHLVGPCGLW